MNPTSESKLNLFAATLYPFPCILASFFRTMMSDFYTMTSDNRTIMSVKHTMTSDERTMASVERTTMSVKRTMISVERTMNKYSFALYFNIVNRQLSIDNSPL